MTNDRHKDALTKLEAPMAACLAAFEQRFRSIGIPKPPAEPEAKRRRRHRPLAPNGKPFRLVRIVGGKVPTLPLVIEWFRTAERFRLQDRTLPSILFWQEKPHVVFEEQTGRWACVGRLQVM